MRGRRPFGNRIARMKLSGKPGLPAGTAAQLGWLFVLVMVVFFAAGVLKELFSRRDARSAPSPPPEFAARRR